MDDAKPSRRIPAKAARSYHPPVKRSVEIAGHKTSISLEPLFWEMLVEAARDGAMPLNALVARIDAERLESDTPPGLASAIRVWLVSRLATGDGPLV
ncbi:MAG TPA: ribbon-helix-helix domain-containing protein [Novosphingobium sp.]|nr:ribbon-helix-helix domain-containing protein [Novosphingobium sp.]